MMVTDGDEDVPIEAATPSITQVNDKSIQESNAETERGGEAEDGDQESFVMSLTKNLVGSAVQSIKDEEKVAI